MALIISAQYPRPRAILHLYLWQKIQDLYTVSSGPEAHKFPIEKMRLYLVRGSQTGQNVLSL